MKYFLLGYTKHKNKAILKSKEIYVQAEKEAIERYTKIKNYMKQVKHEKLKRERVEMLKSKTKEIRENRVLHKIQMESERTEEMEFFDFFN